MNIFRTLFLSVFLSFGSFLSAQSVYQNTGFYLVDSLYADEVNATDSVLIRKVLEKYHAAEHDTTKLAYFLELFDGIENLSAAHRYAEYLEENAAIKQKQVKSVSEKERLQFLEAYACEIQGVLFGFKDDYNQAEPKYEKALGIYRQLNEVERMSTMLSALGQIASYRGNVSKAIDLHTEAVEKAEQGTDTSAIIFSRFYIADTYTLNKNYEKALAISRKNLALAIHIKDSNLIANEFLSIALNSFRLGDTTAAFQGLKKSISVSRMSKNPYRLVDGLNELAGFYLEQNQLDSARLTLDELERISLKHKFNYQLAEVKLQQARIAFKSKQWTIAEEKLKAALELGKQINAYQYKTYPLELLAQVKHEQGKHEEAFSLLQTFKLFEDSISNSQLEKKLMEKSISYEYEKEKAVQAAEHEAELTLAEEKSKTQELLIIISVLVGAVILIALLSIYSQLKTIKKQKVALKEAYRELEIRKNDEVLASNFKALQSQMNPHFIFNALNSIQNFVLKGKVDDSYTYINKFADLIRTTLSFSELELVSFEEEKALLENYLSLEKLRFRDHFDYELKCEDIPALSLPPMLLQPLIENALVHGLLHKPKDRFLSLVFQFDENGFRCELTDNGIGREASQVINKRQNSKHKSFALGALKRRFDYLSRRMNLEAGFTYVDLYEDGKASGTKVLVQIPYVLNR
tara:strand:+ start:9784 stop:11856 length:2073 start_codon:yes stop_codon:yes gene_type:complete